MIQTDADKIKVEQISDGSSNTIMVAEKALHPDGQGLDGGDNERWNNAGWDEDVVRFGGQRTGSGATAVLTGVPPILDKKAPATNDSPAGTKWYIFFGSSHTSGINACMADGSVKMIPFSVEAEVFRRLSLSKDGQPVNGL